MPSSDRPRRGMSRPVLWAVVVGNALLGSALALLAVALLVASPDTWSPATCVVVAGTGLLWVGAGAVGFHRMYLRRPPLDGRRVTVERLPDGSRATVLTWSTTLLTVPAATIGGLVVVLLAGASLQLGEPAPITGVMIGAAVLLALPLPDSLLRLRRRPHRLVLDARGVTVHGWDGDGHLAWDDLADVRLGDTGSWPVLHLIARPGARSATWRRRGRFLSAPAPGGLGSPPGAVLGVPAPVLDVDPLFLAGTLLFYAATPGARHELGDGTARTRLVDRVRPVA